MADGNTLDKLVIELEAKATSGTNSITKLTNALSSLGRATKGIDPDKLSDMTKEVGSFAESAKVADSNISKLVGNLGSLTRATKGANVSGFVKLTDGIKNLNDVSNAPNITKLVGSIRSLVKSLEGANTNGLESIVTQLGRLTKFNGMDTSGITGLVNSLVKFCKTDFSGVDTGKLEETTDTLGKFVTSLNGLDVNAQGIGDLAKGLDKVAKIDFGGVDVDKLKEVTTLLGTLGEKMRGMPSNSTINIKRPSSWHERGGEKGT